MAEFVGHAPRDGVAVLTVAGEVDIAEVDNLLAAARDCLATASVGLDVDLGGVTFIDSSGLGALVRLRNEAADSGKPLTLLRIPASLRRLLEITGLSDSFPPRAEV